MSTWFKTEPQLRLQNQNFEEGRWHQYSALNMLQKQLPQLQLLRQLAEEPHLGAQILQLCTAFWGQIASKSFSMFFELFDFMACRNLFNELSFSASKSCQLNLVTSADVAGHPWDWLRKAQVLEVESNMRASFQFLPCPKTYNPKAYPRICILCTIIYQNMIPVLSSTCHVWRDCFLRK